MSKYQQEAEAIRHVLTAINAAWRAQNYDAMTPRIHDDFVMIMPDFSGRVVGREPLIDSFRDFQSQSTMSEYEETDYEVDVIGSTGVATYNFTIRYSMSGKNYQSLGRDVWGFIQENGAWLAAWRFLTDMQDSELE